MMPVSELVRNRQQVIVATPTKEGARTHPNDVDSSWSASAVAIYMNGVCESKKIQSRNER